MATPEDVRARMGGREVRRIVYTAEMIRDRIAQIGREITEAYPYDEDVLVLGLLKGSFIFVADLVRQIRRPLHVDFLMAASYGAGTVTSGHVRLVHCPETDLAGRHVILVEDIIDSGTTLNKVVPLLRERGPKSLELCALLHKRIAASLVLDARWVGFDAPREFLVGYGLDHGEDYRHLPFIASL